MIELSNIHSTNEIPWNKKSYPYFSHLHVSGEEKLHDDLVRSRSSQCFFLV